MATPTKMASFHMMRNHGVRHQLHQNVQQRKQQVQQHNQQQFHHPQQQFTKQTVDVAKNTEKLQNDKQRLSTLHSKLHKEAEKIRHWKSEKEMEIKQKDRNLSDAIQTIDALRKSIIELQFQNEEYSTKLHDKELEKEETEQKMHTVREMANVLRDQMTQLEDRISKGEQDKEDINQINQNMIEQNQSLVLKFQDLDIGQATMIEKNTKQLQILENKQESQVKDLQANIRHLENQVIALMETKTIQENSINDYILKKKENEDVVDKLQQDLQKIKEKLQHAEQVMFAQDQSLIQAKTLAEDISKQLQQCGEKLAETEYNLKKAEEEREAQQKHATEVESIYSKEINSLQADVNDMTACIQEKSIKVEQLCNDKEEQKNMISEMELVASERIKTIDTLNSRITEFEVCKKDLEETMAKLNHELHECNIKLSDAESKILNAMDNNVNLQQEIKESSERIGLLLKEKEALQNQIGFSNDTMKSIECQMQEKEKSIEDYVTQITSSKDELNEAQQQIDKLSELKIELEKLYGEAQNEILVMEQEISQLKQSNTDKDQQGLIQLQKIEYAEKEISALNSKLEEQQKELTQLNVQEQEQVETIKSELAGQEKKAEDLGNKTKSLQSQISVKTKQIKNMEKENKNIKNLQKKTSEKNNKLEKRINELEEQVRTSEAKTNELVQSLEASNQKTISDKARFDVAQQEFCATLEQYKLENDKIVEEHIKESKNIKAHFEDFKIRCSNESELLRKNIREANTLIENQRLKITELEAGAATLTVKDSRITELEDLIRTAKEDILAEQEKTKQLEEKYDSLLASSKTMKQDTNVGKKHENDRLVPTTPKISVEEPLAAVTPHSILRTSQSNRGKRVLFTGIPDSDMVCPMDTEDMDELSLKPITPSVKKPALQAKNIRFSPKLSPRILQQMEEDERRAYSPGPKIKKLNRISRKPEEKHLHNKSMPKYIDEKPNAFNDSLKQTLKTNIYDSPRAALGRKKMSPGDTARSSFLKNKMKKVKPNIKKNNDQNLSWFDADNVFGFDG